MPPNAPSICLRCEFRAFISAHSSPPQWQSRRTMASAMRQHKPPARMALARDVARSPTGTKTEQKQPSAGPFGAMNQTESRLPPGVRSSLRAAAASMDRTRSTRPAGARKKDGKDERPLFHALKMQATLTPLSYNQRTMLKEKLEEITSFEDFPLLPEVRNAIYTQALPGMTDLVPTPVQKLAIPAMLRQKNKSERSNKVMDKPQFNQFLIAAETGSGKTLAYLLPVIDALKRQEVLDKIEAEKREEQEIQRKAEQLKTLKLDAPELADSPHSTTGRPRALILLPSSELVAQVGKVLKAMSHTIKFRSAPISASFSPTVIRNSLFNPRGIDIIVSTPHLISSIAEKEPNILSRVTHLVIDEADSLLDRSFSPITCAITDRAAPSLKQLILCSATIPRSLDRFLDKRYPQIKRIVTPKLHSVPRRVQLGLVDIDKDPYRGNRSLACADVIWQIGKAIHDDTESNQTLKSIMVFVNERDQAEELTTFLTSKGIEAVALTRDTTEQRNSDILSTFTSGSRLEGDEKEDPKSKSKTFRDFVPFDGLTQPSSSSSTKSTKRLTNTKVLVTTDLGSRGLDTLSVRHIVLFDPPHDTITFIHRLGRLGRMGRRGRAVVLVGKHDRKDVVREVREAMHKGQALI